MRKASDARVPTTPTAGRRRSSRRRRAPRPVHVLFRDRWLGATRATRSAPASGRAPSPRHEAGSGRSTSQASGSRRPARRRPEEVCRTARMRRSHRPRTRTMRVPTLVTCASSPVRRRRSFLLTTRTPLIGISEFATPPTSGWLPCVWCPRVSASPLGCRCLRDERIHAPSSITLRVRCRRGRVRDRLHPSVVPLLTSLAAWRSSDHAPGPSQARGSQRRRHVGTLRDAMVAAAKPRGKGIVRLDPGCRR